MEMRLFIKLFAAIVLMTEACSSLIEKDDLIQVLLKEIQKLGSKVERLETECVLKSDLSDERQRRLLLPDNPSTYNIAFSAYLSHLDNGPAVGKLREIVFDKIETNLGNGYDTYSGTFRAPKDGVYAFTWTIFVVGGSGANGEVWTELVINGQIHGTLHADTETTSDDDSSTGFVIKVLNKDDIVFIRTSNMAVPQGQLHSNHMRWTFSGWLIE
ncbi:complement C1q tumor necrosis factor-related protein 3-like [Mytilus trossulus]|uniref:complement C1q tumor necrosis factor-related protein 3-like n=1 Tax=Mytilus trossulus TaxID=6551 RepID=UPI003005D8C1